VKEPPDWVKEPPDWFTSWLNEVREAKEAKYEHGPAAAPGTPAMAGPGGTTPYGRTALDGELVKLGATPEGARNDQLNTSGFRIGQLVAGGYLDAETAWNELQAKAREIGLDASEVFKTLRSGFHDGQENPRYKEELPPLGEVHEFTSVAELVAGNGDDPFGATESEPGAQIPASVGPFGNDPEVTPDAVRHLRATKASDIQMTATRWLWEDGPHCWIPLGHLVGLGGREGVGKSTMSADIAAKVTNGKLPGDFYGIPKGVIIVSTEDDWSATIKPRLVAAGADLDRVFQVDAIEPDGLEGTLSLPVDLHRLEEIIRTHDVALVILDPLLTLIHKSLDTHKDVEVRRALEPMIQMAHSTKVSLIGLAHVNKSTEGDLLNRIMASKAITSVPRGFLFCAKYDLSGEEDPRTEFVFGQIKNNLAAKVMISFQYHMENEIVGHDSEAGKEIRATKLFIDERPITQNVEDVVLEQEKAKKNIRTKGGKAERWLIDYLDGRGEVPSKSIVKAGRQAGFSRSTLYRARKELEDLDRLKVTNLSTVPKTSTWKLLEEEEEEVVVEEELE
jgi:AAA domain